MSETTNAVATIRKQDLTHLTELDVEIEKYRQEYTGLEIIDEKDTEGYEKVRQALAVLRPRRTYLDKERKSVTEPYREAISYINKRYDEKIAAIEEIEKPLKERRYEIDAVIEAEKEKKRIEAEERVNKRINSLIQNGCVFDGSYYSIGNPELGISETSVGVVDIRSMSDELFETLLTTVIDKNEKIVYAKQLAELKKEEERKEQERIQEQQKAEMKRQQDELEKQKAEMKRQQDELERQKKEMEDALEVQKQQIAKMRMDMIEGRKVELTQMGFVPNGGGTSYRLLYISDDFSSVEISQIENLTDVEWASLKQAIGGSVKLNAEEHKRIKDAEEKEKEEKIRKKIQEEEAEKKKEDDDKKKAELEAMSDKRKYEAFVGGLQAFVQQYTPSTSSKSVKEKISTIVTYINNL